MALKTNRPKGTQDFIPPRSEQKHIIEERFRELAQIYGYREIVTPTFEHTEIFIKSSGISSDIVTKEMYTFNDRSGRSLTLKPEGTPGVVRAVLENRLTLPCRLFYIGPCFRYNKPQKGRYREFYQLGIEAIGEASPLVDAETIEFGFRFLRKLGITQCKVQINSIGCKECRPIYRDKLVDFLQKEKENMCRECAVRIEVNPIRVFDCKNPSCQKRLFNAPVPRDNLCNDCLDHFQKVLNRLGEIDCIWEINDHLVRGLDYYNRTTFEFISPDLGAQSSIGGGGRYDYLFEDLGGPPTPAIGLAIGLERTLLVMPFVEPLDTRKLVFVVWLGEKERKIAQDVLEQIRLEGIPAQISYDADSVRRQFSLADKIGARLVVIVGEEEIAQGIYSLKDLKSGNQISVAREELIDYIKKFFK